MRGHEALERLLRLDGVATVLDIGSGTGEHAEAMRAAGKTVTTISMQPPADVVGDFLKVEVPGEYDAIWASHVLEHQTSPGAFLRKCKENLKPGGWLAVTVPPLKHEIVGGHVGLWNAGLLLYQLILAGFDCRNAKVGTYGYNISVIVQNSDIVLPALAHDEGDVAKLSGFFPVPVSEPFDGRIPDVNWGEVGDRVPKHVAIVALGATAEAYMDHVKRLGSRRKYADEVWAINAMGDVIACDLVVHMDDVRIQEIRAAARPESNIAEMLRWMKTSPVPILTSRAHPDYPSLMEFPLEAVANKLGEVYFNNTVAYAIAYALFLGVEEISLFGCDYTYENAYKAEKGRACVEYWLGWAARAGVKITVPLSSPLLDSKDCTSDDDVYAYGYDTLKIAFSRHDDGSMKFTMTPRETLPTAETIERAYDHRRPPHEQHGRMAAE